MTYRLERTATRALRGSGRLRGLAARRRPTRPIGHDAACRGKPQLAFRVARRPTATMHAGRERAVRLGVDPAGSGGDAAAPRRRGPRSGLPPALERIYGFSAVPRSAAEQRA